MVFGLSKKERSQRGKEKMAYREALTAERIRLAPTIGKQKARDEAKAEIKRNRESATKTGGGLGGKFNAFADFAANATKNIDKSGGLGVYAPGGDPFSPSGGKKKGKKQEDPWSF